MRLDTLLQAPRQTLDRATQLLSLLLQTPDSIERLYEADESDEDGDPEKEHRYSR